jgi:putative holliday junction resolvase
LLLIILTLKIISLDFGNKKIGLAIADSQIQVAAARDFLVNDNSTLKNIINLVKQENIKKIIIGLPYGLRQETKQTKLVRKFAKLLQSKITVPVEFVDERFTSKIAKTNLHAANKNSREQKNFIDSEAARILLQEYLESGE